MTSGRRGRRGRSSHSATQGGFDRYENLSLRPDRVSQPFSSCGRSRYLIFCRNRPRRFRSLLSKSLYRDGHAGVSFQTYRGRRRGIRSHQNIRPADIFVSLIALKLCSIFRPKSGSLTSHSRKRRSGSAHSPPTLGIRPLAPKKTRAHIPGRTTNPGLALSLWAIRMPPTTRGKRLLIPSWR